MVGEQRPGCSVTTSKRTAGCGPRASLPDEHRGWLPAGLCSGCCRSPVWGRATARPRGRCLGLGPPRGPVITERAQSLLGAARSPTEPRPRRGRGAQLQPGPLGGLPARLCPEAALWPAGWAPAGLSAAPSRAALTHSAGHTGARGCGPHGKLALSQPGRGSWVKTLRPCRDPPSTQPQRRARQRPGHRAGPGFPGSPPPTGDRDGGAAVAPRLTGDAASSEGVSRPGMHPGHPRLWGHVRTDYPGGLQGW